MTLAAVRPVGVIGLGTIGLPVAARLLAQGRTVHGYRKGSSRALEEIGGVVARSVAEIAAACDPILLVLPDDVAFNCVIEQLVHQPLSGHAIVSLSTHDSAVKERAKATLRVVGADLIEAEISGTPAMLQAGAAFMMIAGDLEKFEGLRTTLESLAPLVRLERFGDALRLKLVTNFLVAVHTLAAAQALSFGAALGLSSDLLLRALTQSAGASRMLAVRGPMMLREEVASGDLQGFLRFFDLLRSAVPSEEVRRCGLLEATEEVYRAAASQGWGGADLSVVYKFLRALELT